MLYDYNQIIYLSGQVEDYIRREVLSLYGNTHTTTSISGHQSTCFRNESRQIIAQSVNARVKFPL